MRVRSVAFSFALTIVLALGAASVAFVAGRQAADAPGAYERGAKEGERFGRTETYSVYRRGTPAYRAIYRRGADAGFDRGRRVGRALGRRHGRDATFAGFPGGWAIGSWYLINVAPGTDGGRYAIGGRVRVRKGAWYGVCARGARICTRGADRVRAAPAPRRVVPN